MSQLTTYIFFAYDTIPMVGETVYDGIVIATTPEEALLLAAQSLGEYLEEPPVFHYLKLFPAQMPPMGQAGIASINYENGGVYGEYQLDGSVKVLQEEFALAS